MENKICLKCGLEKPISEFPLTSIHKNGKRYVQSKCRTCSSKNAADRKHERGYVQPMQELKDSSLYLGVCVAEKALSKFFDQITRMPHGNKGFDFLCGKGFKIDVKSSCPRKQEGHSPRWLFNVRKNIIADYFLCLAFDSRDNLDPQHVWLIPGNIINYRTGFGISDTSASLKKWAKYERPLDKVIICCNALKEAG